MIWLSKKRWVDVFVKPFAISPRSKKFFFFTFIFTLTFLLVTLKYLIDRSNLRRCFAEKVFLEISQNSQENLRPATLLKKGLWHRCFFVNFAKFLRTIFFTEHLRRLLLDWVYHNGLFTKKPIEANCKIP